MSWNNSDGRAWPGDATGGWKPDEGAWKPEDSRGDTWGSGGDTTGNDNWGVGVGGGANDGVFGGEVGGGDGSGDGGGDRTCRICKQEGHFARECPDKPASGSLTGVCFNCREVGHNKADCPNPVVEHTMACRLCQQEGHRAVECTSRRKIDWTGVPELSVQDAWSAIVDSAKDSDIDRFRIALRSYARAMQDDFNLSEIEEALRADGLPIYLIAKQQNVAPNMVIVDLVGNPDREFVLTIQLSAKPRRRMLAAGWPESPDQNLERLASAGFVQDRGIPICSNCGGKSTTYCYHSLSQLLIYFRAWTHQEALQAGTCRERAEDSSRPMCVLPRRRSSRPRLPEGAYRPLHLQELQKARTQREGLS
ncbi:hypothetical protein CC78DRAFT_25192 [Lojkania enalia]|uniref:CCHC-type domain-containing protein n=1 Tax=Lojkania enalia TaxID=147567 RepID=A0A9P4K1K3_9PLEO|nr:hypothetical protein CC78DRAFT_25192 [Didymosphaeria enalia]